MLTIDCTEFVKDHAFQWATYKGYDVEVAAAYAEWYGTEFAADATICELSHQTTFPEFEAAQR